MTSAEQIKALRNCVNVNYEYPAEDASCLKCPYIEVSHCKRTLMRAAIDALEAAEKRIADQQKQIAKLSTLLNNKIEELEAQFLKEGEWKWNSLLNEYEWVNNTIYCPNCGARMRKGDGNI